MDRMSTYRAIVRQVFQNLADYLPLEEGIRTEVILDDANGHYELLQSGWQHERRVHGALVHIDVREDKVWVEHDGTDLEVVQDLLDAGVPCQDMVIGFHPPGLRRYTEFSHAA